MLKRYLILLFFFCSTTVFCQITWAEIGVDGLTCSACTRSVEMSIRKLDFVDSVSMNLEHTQGKITFKKGTKIEIEKVAQAVVNSGFSLRYLKAAFIFNNTEISEGYCYSYENMHYQFTNVSSKKLDGEIVLRFLGNKYMSKKEWKGWKDVLKNKCAIDKKNLYYVTL